MTAVYHKWYDVQCVECGVKIHVGDGLDRCPSCGTNKAPPKPLPAVVFAQELVEAYLSKKSEAMQDPSVLDEREYAGLMVRMYGRDQCLEGFRSMPRAARKRWKGTGPILEKLRALEEPVEEGSTGGAEA